MTILIPLTLLVGKFTGILLMYKAPRHIIVCLVPSSGSPREENEPLTPPCLGFEAVWFHAAFGNPDQAHLPDWTHRFHRLPRNRDVLLYRTHTPRAPYAQASRLPFS